MRALLWLARTEGLDPDGLTARISPRRRAELAEYAPEARLHSAGAELLLLRAVETLRPGLSPERGRGEDGKPCLLTAPDFHFNLSHSGGWAVCAVADCPVGVDIQQYRPVRADISRKFAPQERELLAALPDGERDAALFQIWAVKESFFKCRGTGLREGLRRPAVTLPVGSVEEEGYVSRLLHPPEENYALAVCLAGAGEPEWRTEFAEL